MVTTNIILRIPQATPRPQQNLEVEGVWLELIITPALTLSQIFNIVRSADLSSVDVHHVIIQMGYCAISGLSHVCVDAERDPD